MPAAFITPDGEWVEQPLDEAFNPASARLHLKGRGNPPYVQYVRARLRMDSAKNVAHRMDQAQRRHPWLAFSFAVIKKFGDDQAGNLAALIAYYGFFSMFPLLLVFVTILGMAIKGDVALQQRIEDSALSNFPVLGTQISQNIHSLSGGGFGLVLGIVLALWAGLGVLKAMQTAMNTVWNVPYRHRPNFFVSILKALLMLVVLGAVTVASAAAGTVGAGSGSWLLGAVGIGVALVLNFVLFMLAFRILTTEDVSWLDVRPGAIVAALAWTTLQAAGGYYVSHQLQSASDTYGTFATVIGLLAWIFLAAQATLFAAEINVVKKRRLWPRSIVQPPLTEADERALKEYAEQEERRPEEDVEVQIHGRPS
jgi:YihY family inner membrane protein